MAQGFQDHPRKRIVRSEYNTPLLARLSELLRAKYVYLGLPGPEMHDISEWRHLIRKVIAFERGLSHRDGISELARLERNLRLAGIPAQVYVGDMERVVIWGRDARNREFRQDELITLYNLDFCDNISSCIRVPGSYSSDGGGRSTSRCMRFDALRKLLRLQADLYANGADPRFIILLTVREGLSENSVSDLRAADSPPALQRWLDAALPRRISAGQLLTSPAALKAFVFWTLRSYCQNVNVTSHFLPMVRYSGRGGAGTKMAHFAVLCRFAERHRALPCAAQKVNHFLALPSLRATEGGLEPAPLALRSGELLERGKGVDDICAVAEAFFA